MEYSKETMCFRHNRTNAHVNSQRPREDAQGLHRFKPDGVPVMRGKSGQKPPSITKELSPVSIHLQRKNSFSPMDYYWVY